MSDHPLVEEWRDLLERRPAFREVLSPFAAVIEAWAGWSAERVRPLGAGAEECRERWGRGVPLLAEVTPAIDGGEVEDLLAAAMDILGALGKEEEPLRRFAEAWDARELGVADLLPRRGRIGAVEAQTATGLSQEFLCFLGYAGLRPALAAYFADCRGHLRDGDWDTGICPFCGAPPGFGDLVEDGRRRLACHFCAGSWVFARLQCPYCGTRNINDLVRLQGEDKEEGYLVSACKACHGYLKEVDRRLRWNAASALVEDWGTPHLDLLAHRSEYWRPIPTLIDLQGAA